MCSCRKPKSYFYSFRLIRPTEKKKWTNSIITSQLNHLQTTIVCKSFLYPFPSNYWQKITPNYSSPWKVKVNGEFKPNRCISIEYIWMKCRPINRCVRFPYSSRLFDGHLIECIFGTFNPPQKDRFVNWTGLFRTEWSRRLFAKNQQSYFIIEVIMISNRIVRWITRGSSINLKFLWTAMCSCCVKSADFMMR